MKSRKKVYYVKEGEGSLSSWGDIVTVYDVFWRFEDSTPDSTPYYVFASPFPTRVLAQDIARKLQRAFNDGYLAAEADAGEGELYSDLATVDELVGREGWTG